MAVAALYYFLGVLAAILIIIVIFCLNSRSRVLVVRVLACCLQGYHSLAQSCSWEYERCTGYCRRKRARVVTILTDHLHLGLAEEGPPLNTAPEIQISSPESGERVHLTVRNSDATPASDDSNNHHSPLIQRTRPLYNIKVAGGVGELGTVETGTTGDGEEQQKAEQTANNTTNSKHTSLQDTRRSDMNENDVNESAGGAGGGGGEEITPGETSTQNKEGKQTRLMAMFNQPVKKEDLEEFLTHAIRSDLLAEQFTNVPARFNKSMVMGVLPCNRKKNRYRNNIPYDDTRVLLGQDVNATPGSDYINANFVRSIGKTKAYIASQGPKDFNDRTIEQFWSMVWQEKTNVVVMLGKLTEAGKVKVAQYWPEVKEEMRYGEVRVQVTSYQERLDYALRRMLVSSAGECREVVHYQFLKWPDHGVPQTPFTFALMVQDMCKWQRSGPLLVHCSAGMGRTGTLLLVLTLLDHLETQGHLRPIDALISLRLDRPNLVENQAQYRFAHQVLLEVLFCETTSWSASQFCQQLEVIRPHLKEQYQKLKSLPKNLTTRWGELAIHAPFNRNPNILPVDGRQVFLQTVGGRGDSQYLNAVRVHGMRQRDALIVTEHPLTGTLDRAWRMIYEKRALAWVIIHKHTDEKEYPPVLPSTGAGDLDHFNVRIDDITQHNEFTDTSVTLTPIKSRMSLPHTLRVLHMSGWDADKELPDSPLPLLEILQHLQYIRLHAPVMPTTSVLNTALPVVITCRDGTTGCGVLVALLGAQCRLELQGVVDIYRAVQAILFDRPQFITSLAQYEFLYNTMGICIQCRLPYLHLSLPEAEDDSPSDHDSDDDDDEFELVEASWSNV
ncbi:hypothetical protein Pcinc_039863 [Petrolisthes cinctipes]|uniref:protein-tyrosine-phosphatase n=1 Tax=Petrolisthes cinctipes TaxID=88211 RepID=A0AAE1BN54_PETCI|nr:hypothetical protein Pcinc_039863 [Petrolisthes cinctipes]